MGRNNELKRKKAIESIHCEQYIEIKNINETYIRDFWDSNKDLTIFLLESQKGIEESEVVINST